MPPPVYLGGGSVYDISMLADAQLAADLPPGQADTYRRQLAAVNLLDSAAFPTAALAALTTLDRGQIAALTVGGLAVGLWGQGTCVEVRHICAAALLTCCDPAHTHLRRRA